MHQRVGTLSDRAAVTRLDRAVLAEQTDEWAEQRRYVRVEVLTKSRQTRWPASAEEVATPTANQRTTFISGGREVVVSSSPRR